MARIRTIKPEFAESESNGRLSRDARLLFILLISHADDYGRFRANPRWLANTLFPFDDDARGLIEAWLDELDGAGKIRLFRVKGDSYGDIPKWAEHQKVDKPGKPRLPTFEQRDNLREPSRDSREDVASLRETLAPDQYQDHRPPTVKEEPDQIIQTAAAEKITSRARAERGESPPPPDIDFPIVQAMDAELSSELDIPIGQLEVKALPMFSARDASGFPPSEVETTPTPIPKTERIRGVVDVTPPDAPPETWNGEDFLRWVQYKRIEAGYIPERERPHPRTLGDWWNACLMTPGVTAHSMKASFVSFGQDKYWGGAKPAFPFKGFMSQWDRFHPDVEEGESHEAH